ncbi:hypothetical protein AERO8C_20339 [Aeromonas veronii]|uniref:Uncharacterized protein n=1 Tax=Aeromonas veronii TaxID=654 RepID=A0A653L0N7_AERVE|nr:hypothetical protein AERO8C_20339 [Aeromonas veronii]
MGNPQGKYINTQDNYVRIDRGFIDLPPFIFLTIQSYQVKISSCWQANFVTLAHRILEFFVYVFTARNG